MYHVILPVVGSLHAHHVCNITLMAVAGFSGLRSARKPVRAVLLARGVEGVIVWFGVWTGHTWDLCLLYSGISIECAKC